MFAENLRPTLLVVHTGACPDIAIQRNGVWQFIAIFDRPLLRGDAGNQELSSQDGRSRPFGALSLCLFQFLAFLHNPPCENNQR